LIVPQVCANDTSADAAKTEVRKVKKKPILAIDFMIVP
jgi:hypothetical protein